MIRLDPRLQAAAELVLPGRPLADIGTDHAYLPIYLVGSGRCPWAVAADKAASPIQSAAPVIGKYGLAERISLRCGDGLAVLQPGEVDTIVICGMGGQLMLDILDAGPDILAQTKRLVLQPQKHIELVRYWLAGHAWRIVDEAMVESKGFFYAVIAAEPGEMELNSREAEYGPVLLQQRGDAFKAWIRRQIAERETICRGLRDQDSFTTSERLAELQAEISILKQLLE